MAAQITPPSPNEDARVLWRKVVECMEVVDAISNMTVVVEGQVKMIGKLTVSGGSSRLELKENREVAG